MLVIKLKLNSLDQIFDMRDPSPFRVRDLDSSFARYLVVAARESRSFRSVQIEVELSHEVVQGLGTLESISLDLRQAIRDYFHFEAQSELANIKDILANGRRSLVYGFLFLGICQLISMGLRGWKNSAVEFFDFGLQIVGWVALWKPIELLLHEWWPHLELRKMYLKLAAVELKASAK